MFLVEINAARQIVELDETDDALEADVLAQLQGFHSLSRLNEALLSNGFHIRFFFSHIVGCSKKNNINELNPLGGTSREGDASSNEDSFRVIEFDESDLPGQVFVYGALPS